MKKVVEVKEKKEGLEELSLLSRLRNFFNNLFSRKEDKKEVK